MSNPSMNNTSQDRINIRNRQTSIKKRQKGTSKRSQEIHITNNSQVREDDDDDFSVSDNMMNESVFL